MQTQQAHGPTAGVVPFPTPPKPSERAMQLVNGLARLQRLELEMAAKIIDLLDEADDDPDLEPDLGAAERCGRFDSQVMWGQGRTDGREEEADAEPDSEGEPNLGAPENHPGLFPTYDPTTGRRSVADQRHWAGGGDADDREAVSEDEGAQCDDEGMGDRWNDVDCEYSLGRSEAIDQSKHQTSVDDKEPSLGSLAAIDQTHWAHGGAEGWVHRDFDHEVQCEDEGSQSDDEGHGQAPCHSFYDEGRRVWPPAAPAA